jgi:tetratricopeptide (TPR) repeat protein
MLMEFERKLRHGRDPCSYKRNLFRVAGLKYLYLFVMAAMLLLISGCTTLPSFNSSVVNIDHFPEYANHDGPNINPSYVDQSIPDVDILALDDEMKFLLDDLVARIKNPEQKLNLLVEIVSHRVVYDTLDDKFGTKTAEETFESGTGNCLSFVNLFVAMARYAGLQSGFQDIPTPPNWVKNGDALFITRHVGAFVDYYSPGQAFYRIDFLGGKSVVVSNNDNRFLFAPSIAAGTPEFNPKLVRSIPDNQAFAQYYNNLGSKYLVESKGADAFRYFVKAIKTDPVLSYAWSNLGVAYSRNNQVDAAEDAYKQALTISRERGDDVSALSVMNNMARLYARTGNIKQAAFYEKEVAAFRNKNPYYHFSIGKIAYNDGRYEESVKDFKEAISKKEDEHLFHFALALSYYKMGEIDKAEKSLDKAKLYVWDKAGKDYYDQIREDMLKNEVCLPKPIG